MQKSRRTATSALAQVTELPAPEPCDRAMDRPLQLVACGLPTPTSLQRLDLERTRCGTDEALCSPHTPQHLVSQLRTTHTNLL